MKNNNERIPNIAIEQNTISRDWDIRYKGKKYLVNLTYSDGQILALCNRGYWDIKDENGEEVCYAFKGQEAELSEKEQEQIIAFCIKNFLAGKFNEELKEVMCGC